jgi:hypothetical protein
MSENRRIYLAGRPRGLPERSCFELRAEPLPEPGPGEALVRAVFLSVDPYMRGRMNDVRSYVEPFAVGAPLTGGVVGRVVRAPGGGPHPGGWVLGDLEWAEYSVAPAAALTPLDPAELPVSTALGVAGMPGLTAYFGLLDVGASRPGETVVISGAAGAVGATAGQIARRHGCRVVGIAGSEEKLRWLQEDLGFDAAVSYKAGNLKKSLERVCPAGVDVYFDNVGGEVTDRVLPLLNRFSRVVLCGQIALYNMTRPELGPRLWPILLVNRVRVQGFIVHDFQGRFSEARGRLVQWVRSGELKYRETVIRGLENAPDALLGLFRGDNIGKMLVQVAE